MSSVGWVWLSINREIRFIVVIYNNMKNYSKISVFLFIICVFGDYGGRAERVSVMEGDSLTLDIDLREKFNHIMWTFGDSYSIIAETDGYEASYGKDERFRDRLKMNNQTGSLTIKNMRVTDSGVYHLEINHNSVISYKRFIITVHVFGADEDDVKRESVMEGDSVTLDIDLTERFNRIEWRFGDSGSVIAESDGNEASYTKDERFRGRLKMNNQTGSLTINNMAIANSGVYKLRFDHNTGTSSATFIVIVCDPALSPGEVTAIVVVVLLVLSAAAAVLYYHHKISKRRRQNLFGDYEDGVKRESVMEGDSVTLDTRLREKFNHIMWMFGDSGSVIAEIDGNKIPYTDDERFRDRLKMNNLTGSLTIKNMRDTDSGVYHLEINGTSNKTFNVTVHVFGDYEDGVKRVSVMEGDSVTLDIDLTEFNHINWLFGDSYSFISKSDGDEISYPLNDTERFRDRLKMNNQTGSLTINNMRITDSGVYEIEMHHDTWEPYEKIEIVVCEPFYPDLALSPGEVTAIVVVVLLVLSAAAAVLYYHHKISKRRRQNREYYS